MRTRNSDDRAPIRRRSGPAEPRLCLRGMKFTSHLQQETACTRPRHAGDVPASAPEAGWYADGGEPAIAALINNYTTTADEIHGQAMAQL